MRKRLYYARLETPVGRIWAASSGRGLCRLGLPGEDETAFWAWLRRRFGESRLKEDVQRHAALRGMLIAYFCGELREFDVQADLLVTPFQEAVLRQIAQVPYGRTTSYGQIASCLGKPRACRAVGAAARSNPLPIVIPCHRVIGADGRLVGYNSYSGSDGLPFKAMLLELEGHRVQNGRVVH